MVLQTNKVYICIYMLDFLNQETESDSYPQILGAKVISDYKLPKSHRPLVLGSLRSFG